LRALAPAPHAALRALRRRALPRRLAREQRPHHGLARRRRARERDADAAALTAAEAALRADGLAAPRPRSRPPCGRAPRARRGPASARLAPRAVEADLPHRPPGLPLRRPPDQRHGA